MSKLKTLNKLQHLYKMPSMVTKKIHRTHAAAYSYSLTEKQAEKLPDHYVKRCIEFHEKDPKPVHYVPMEGKWRYCNKGERILPVQNIPIPLRFPPEANKGLWGGEGVIQGMYKGKKHFDNRNVALWKPLLMSRLLYSEILDKWFEVTVTFHTLDQIDLAMGFDNYILGTHERDINSQLGMKFRREMLIALARQEFYPNDPKKKARIIKKYARYCIPEEEAEWIGLSVPEALDKAYKIKQDNFVLKPKKIELKENLIYKLTGTDNYEDNNEEEEIPEDDSKTKT